jgi:glycosyltransferase involved in cell wall biosynthesis
VDFKRQNTTFHCIKTPAGFRAPSLFWFDTIAIRKALRKIKPDVVHAWGTEKGAGLVASRLPYPYLLSIQGLMAYFAQVLPVNKYERVAGWFEKLSLKRASFVSGESSFVVDYLRKHYPRLNVFHVEHTPTWSFFDLKRIPKTEPIQFLAVGGMGYRKGTDLILLALDRLKHQIDFKLTLIGFSASKEFLDGVRAKTSPELWDRVTVMRTATDAELLKQICETTMILFPTRADTGPVAVKEAAVAGVPVLGSRMGGIPDYITNDLNGMVFEPGDLDGFCSTIMSACRHPLFRKGHVDQARLTKAREHLSPTVMADRFAAIYRRLGADVADAPR